MYILVRQQKDKIPWTKLVWFSQGVPRFDFITWLVFQDRLPLDTVPVDGVRPCCLFYGETRWDARPSLFLRVRIRSLSGCRLWGLCLVLNLTQTGRSPLRRCSQDLMIDSRSSCFIGFYKLLSISFGRREMQGSTTRAQNRWTSWLRWLTKQ